MADRKLIVHIAGDASSLQRAFGQAGKSANGFGNTMSRMGRATRVAFVAAGAAAAAGLAVATKAAADFEKEMRNVNSIAKLGERGFKDLSKSVTGMAADVGQSPKVLAAGLYDIASSGFEAGEAVKVLRVSAIAATAGLTDTATASKAVTAALNAYHQGAGKARQVSDVLFQTVNKGVITFEELSQQMGDLVPAAAPLGVSLEDVGAGMATLTLQGVTASEAATRMKNAMLTLAKPSKALTGLLQEQGYESGIAAVKALGFAGVLDLISTATKGDVGATAALTPQIRTLMGIVGLTGKNLEIYNRNLKAMKDAQKGAGITAKVFAEQSKSVAVQWQKLSAALDVLKIGIGQALIPALSAAVRATTDFVNAFSQAEGASAKFKVVVGAIEGLALSAWAALKTAFNNIQWVRIWDTVKAKIAAVDWNATARSVGDSLVRALDAAAKAVARVDWTKVGEAIGDGIKTAIRSLSHVDWGKLVVKAMQLNKRLLVAFAQVYVALGKSLALGLVEVIKKAAAAAATVAISAGKSVGTAVIRGIKSGISAGLDALKRLALRAALAIVEPFNIKVLGKSLIPGMDSIVKSIKAKLEETSTPAKTAGENMANNYLLGAQSRFDAFTFQVGNPGVRGTAGSAAPGRTTGGAGARAAKPPPPPTGTSSGAARGSDATQRNAWFDAALSRSMDMVADITSVQAKIAALKKVAATIMGKISAQKDKTRKLNLGDQLRNVQRQIRDLYAGLAADFQASLTELSDKLKLAEVKALGTPTNIDDIRVYLAQLKELRGKFAKATSDGVRSQIQAAINTVNAALAGALENNKVLERLDKIQSGRQAGRALEDAQAEMKQARMLGGPIGIKLANRTLEDAKLEMARMKAQGINVGFKAPGLTRFDPSSTNQTTITVNIHSNQDPEKIAKQVLAQLQKGAKAGGQQRGRTPGHHLGGF